MHPTYGWTPQDERHRSLVLRQTTSAHPFQINFFPGPTPGFTDIVRNRTILCATIHTTQIQTVSGFLRVGGQKRMPHRLDTKDSLGTQQMIARPLQDGTRATIRSM